MKSRFKALALFSPDASPGKAVIPHTILKDTIRSQSEGSTVFFLRTQSVQHCAPHLVSTLNKEEIHSWAYTALSTSRPSSPTSVKRGSRMNPVFPTLTFGGLCDLLATPFFQVWSHQGRKTFSSSFFLNCIGCLCFLPLSSGLKFFSLTRCSAFTGSALLSLVFHLLMYHRFRFLK